MLSKNSVKQIASAYEWSIGKTIDLGPNLLYRTCPRWRMPLVAPIQLVSSRLKVSDLKSIEAHFAKTPAKHPFDIPRPYVQWLDDPYFDSKANKSLLRENGWTSALAENTYLNLWRNVQPAVVPTGYEVKITHYVDARNDFLDLMATNFNSDKTFIRDVDWSNTQSNKQVVCALIYSGKGSTRRAVAGGLAQSCGRATYLYSGSVNKTHRGRGLWRLLLAARQSMTNTGDGHCWVLSSSNDLIKRSGDYSARMMIYEKPAAET